MERSEYYRSLGGDIKCRYEDKLKLINGIDPYTLKAADFTDARTLPKVAMMDLVNYLILTHSFYTGQQLKAFKSLQAFKYYEAGLVQHVVARKINSDAYIAVGMVRHSQRFNEKPLKAWIIILNDGSIASGHCTCMAGLGEVCSHVAAILFYLNAQPTADEACTSKLSVWPVPPLKNAEMCRIRDISWARKTKTKAPTGVPKLTPGEMGSFLNKLYDTGVTAAVARLVEPVASRIEEDICVNLPPSLDLIYKCEFVGKTYDEILQAANEIKITITTEQIKHVEEVTREQYLSSSWFNQRTGRITASMFKAVCRTTLEKPSLSIIKGICYPRKMTFYSKQTKYGHKHEQDALEAYSNLEKQNHENFSVKNVGLFISDAFPELGASPDGIFSCNCCGQGCVEVKCPYLLKTMTILEYAKKTNTCLIIVDNNICIDKNHAYYYQVQLQMFVTKLKICHFVVWSPNELFVQHIELDDDFLQKNVVKALNFFKYVIKPELLGKLFTENFDTNKITVWCICKKIDDGRKMMKCDNDDCTVGWYHFDCVGLEQVPDMWLCNECNI